jgi:hypothetical protein
MAADDFDRFGARPGTTVADTVQLFQWRRSWPATRRKEKASAGARAEKVALGAASDLRRMEGTAPFRLLACKPCQNSKPTSI